MKRWGSAAVGLVLLTGCQLGDQLQATVRHMPRAVTLRDPRVVSSTVENGGSYWMQIDCTGAAVTLTDVPEGVTIAFGLGSSPPYDVPLTDGGANRFFPRAGYDLGDLYWSMLFRLPTGDVSLGGNAGYCYRV